MDEQKTPFKTSFLLLLSLLSCLFFSTYLSSLDSNILLYSISSMMLEVIGQIYEAIFVT